MNHLAGRVLRSEPARGPLQLHHLNGKTQMGCGRCGNVTQTRVVATVDRDWTKLVDRGCYEAWSREFGSAAEPSS